jgi:hypothetical protein
MKLLREGDSNDDVKVLQSLLRSQGHFDGPIKANFGPATTKAVIYFQMTHLDSQGGPLEADGIVGDKTWWALQNSSGKAQSSGLPALVPKGLSAERTKVLEWAANEHVMGVKETPDGSNWGQRVSHYIKTCGLNSPAPWCGCYVSTAIYEALGYFPLDKPQPHVQTFLNRAKSAGVFHSKEIYSPIPGDIFIFAHPDGTGHTGFVASVAASIDPQQFNTNEGNCGNRVKFGRRSVSERYLVGFVNLWGDNFRGFEARLISAADAEGATTV